MEIIWSRQNYILWDPWGSHGSQYAIVGGIGAAIATDIITSIGIKEGVLRHTIN